MTSWFTTDVYRSAAWEANQHLVYSTRIRNVYIFLDASANTSGVSTGYAKRQDGDGDGGLVKPLGIFCYLLCLQCSIVVKQVTQTGTLPILHDRDVTNGKFTAGSCWFRPFFPFCLNRTGISRDYFRHNCMLRLRHAQSRCILFLHKVQERL